MAQTKTRASTKRSSTSKRASPKKTQARAKSKAAASRRSSNGKARIKAVRQTVEHTTKDAGKTVGKVASKAKTPLLAGGAALAGAAGGMALGAMRSRHSHSHKLLGVKMPQPKRVKVRSRDVARAAKEVGTFGQHVGELATELRHAREESGNGNKHRSPVEVVLDGLTARR
jgi:hypothetical protein